jgi:hypothetical protein
VDVVAVGDQLDEHFVVEQGGGGEPRPVVQQPDHRVEQVGGRGATGRVAGLGLLEGRRAVAHRHADAARSKVGDELERARPFRRDRDEPDPVDERRQLVGRHGRRLAQEARVVGALARLGQERAFEVGAQWLGAVRRRDRAPVADPRRERGECLEWRAGRGRQEGRDAVPREGAGHAGQRVHVAHRVMAAPAVDVDIDEAGCQERPVDDGLVDLDRGDDVVLDREPPADDALLEDESPDELGRPAHRAAPRSGVAGSSTSKSTSIA